MKIGAAGSKIKIGAAGSKIKIGAPGSEIKIGKCGPGNVMQKLERMSQKKIPNHWRKEIRQWVCSSTGMPCTEQVQMML